MSNFTNDGNGIPQWSGPTPTGDAGTALLVTLPQAVSAAITALQSAINALSALTGTAGNLVKIQSGGSGIIDAGFSASAFDSAGAASAVQSNLNTHTGNHSNPHATNASQVGLGNVANALQLVKANNLSDLSNASAARTNLGLGTASTFASSAFVAASAVNAANGVAPLDGSGKVPTANLPASVLGALNYQGTWDASANSPTLTSGTGTKGFYYKVSTAGTSTLDGISNWNAGDLAAFDGTAWQKIDGTVDSVTTFNGRYGAVSPQSSDYAAFYIPTVLTTAGDLLTFDGTNYQRVATGSSGQVLTASGSGGYSWTTPGSGASSQGSSYTLNVSDGAGGWIADSYPSWLYNGILNVLHVGSEYINTPTASWGAGAGSAAVDTFNLMLDLSQLQEGDTILTFALSNPAAVGYPSWGSSPVTFTIYFTTNGTNYGNAGSTNIWNESAGSLTFTLDTTAIGSSNNWGWITTQLDYALTTSTTNGSGSGLPPQWTDSYGASVSGSDFNATYGWPIVGSFSQIVSYSINGSSGNYGSFSGGYVPTVNVSGADLNGYVQVTTVGTPTQGGALCTVNFTGGFDNAPTVIIVPDNTTANNLLNMSVTGGSADQSRVTVTSSGSGFTIQMDADSTLPAGYTFLFRYAVIGV